MDKWEKETNKKYLVLVSALGVNFLSGMIYMWSIISKSLIEDLNWTSSQASLPYTLFTVSFVVAMVLMGRVQDQKGPRFVLTIGVIFMGLGIILSGLNTTPMTLVVTMGLIAGSGVGMITVSSSPAAIKWFPAEKKGLITGIVVAGAGLSSVFYSPLASYTLEKFGVSKTFYIIGLIALIPSLIFSRGLSIPPEEKISKKKSENYENSQDFSPGEMLANKSFYMLWLILAFGSSAGLMIIGHISTIADIQLGWKAGFILVILLAVFNTMGRLLGGMFSDKIGRINLIRISLVLQLINMILFKTYSTKLLISVGVAVAGFCYGSSFSVFPATVADFYGMANYGINYGLMFTAWGAGGIIGPMIAASIYDRIGSYNMAFLVATALLLISIILSFFIRDPRKK